MRIALIGPSIQLVIRRTIARWDDAVLACDGAACAAIVFFRLATTSATSLSWMLLPARSGDGGSSFCADCRVVDPRSLGVDCSAVVLGSFVAGFVASVRILSDCRASSALALGFTTQPLDGAAGGTGSGVGGVSWSGGSHRSRGWWSGVARSPRSFRQGANAVDTVSGKR